MRGVVLACGLPFLLAAGSARVLVYSFTYESTQTYDSDKAYGLDKMDPQGGGTFMFHNVNQHYRSPDFDAPQSRSGTLSLTIVGTESDGGLVLRVSEPAATAADGGGTTCVAFSDTSLVCDPNHPISPEARAVLALMSPDFVDAARLDGLRRWHTAPAGSPGTQADFRIVRADGNVLDVSENASRTTPGSPLKAGISAAIAYDAARSLPLSVDQSTVEHVQRGVVAVTITTHAVLKLEDAPHH